MSLLTSNNLIDIKLYYQIIKTRNGQKVKVLGDKEAELAMEENKLQEKQFKDKEENKDKEFELDSNKVVHVLNTKWKDVSWKEQNQSLKSCMIINNVTGNPEIDQIKFRDLKVKSCLKEWDLKDDNNAPIPCDPRVIDELPFDVIVGLVNKYDKLVVLGEEEEKKS